MSSTRARDLSEARERENATAEVLRIISSSRGELEPVFKAILENATQICGAEFGNLFLRTGDAFRAVAVHGPQTSYVAWYRQEPVINLADIPNTPLARIAESKEVIHFRDLREDQAYLAHNPRLVALVEFRRGTDHPGGAFAQSRRTHRGNVHLPPGGSCVHRKANRIGQKLREPGRYCH